MNLMKVYDIINKILHRKKVSCVTMQSQTQDVVRAFDELQSVIQPYIDNVLSSVRIQTSSINIVKLVQQYGLSVLTADMSHSVDAILHHTNETHDVNNAGYSIVVNRNLTFEEKRFAIARQFGKYIMCTEYMGSVDYIPDRALDLFALCVLIPERGARAVLCHVSRKIGKNLTMQQQSYCLQKKYDVSFKMAAQRVATLKYVWSEPHHELQQESLQEHRQQKHATGEG